MVPFFLFLMMMKYIFTVLLLGFSFLSFSQDEEMCECHEFQLKMLLELEEMKQVSKMNEAIELNKPQIEKCQKIADDRKARLSGLSKKDRKKAEKKYTRSCSAFKTLKKMKKKDRKKEEAKKKKSK
jgi:hypothetical protein